jgi:hypothetical protein
MRSVPFLLLAALGVIALGGFLITVYGKARYNEGIEHCKATQAKANDNEHKQRNKLRHKARKKVASIDDIDCDLLANGWLRERDCK